MPDPLKKLRKIITKFPPQGTRRSQHRFEEEEVQNLYKALIGALWHKRRLRPKRRLRSPYMQKAVKFSIDI